MFNALFSADYLNAHRSNMTAHVDILFLEVNEQHLIARMPVDYRTTQPMGILHGGASVVLAETLGSVGALAHIDSSKYYPVGLEINANHIRTVRNGYVYGKATPIHLGRRTHVWGIEITDEEGKLVCISRLTVAILERES
ncbi:MAG: hotdog fold thioesterase [Flammeovirgaceae bacterium]|nr:hotdog fold thioesterase [Flammeovirgaceae bacterium]MDW8286440.1 hotdog fold thioesterase [Flammeovirgaceae bacterium]